jgi:hypothetical protein
VKVFEIAANCDLRDAEEAAELRHFNLPAFANQFENFVVALQIQHSFFLWAIVLRTLIRLFPRPESNHRTLAVFRWNPGSNFQAMFVRPAVVVKKRANKLWQVKENEKTHTP